jgi:H+/Cl- antiporter ClcA/CBS-domain-containing membrane protein
MMQRVREAWIRHQAQSKANSRATDSDIGSNRAQISTQRARRRANLYYFYHLLNGIFRFHPHEQWLILQAIAKWMVLGGIVGALAGTASAVFLISLAWATATRTANPILLYLLPLVGFLLGWSYHTFAGPAARGNNLVIEEANANRNPIPLRMAPMVLIGTVLTHLFGGSAGREGTAVQMGSSLADWAQRVLGLSRDDRRLMILAGISGGFGSVFGTPLAGFVFGLEVQRIGRIEYRGVLPCLVASVIGDLVTRAWGAPHAHYPHMPLLALDPALILRIVIAGIAFGLVSLLFIEVTHGVNYILRQTVRWMPLRPLVGGIVVILLTFAVGSRDYLGLGLPLIHQSLEGTGVVAFAFLFKLIFTAVTLGSGFLGGEVTPLFVIGSTLGYSLGHLLGIDPTLLAAIGFVAVFAGASNTPLACALMGIELFGGGGAIYLAIGCFVAYLASGHRSIYITQLIGDPKAIVQVQEDDTLATLTARRSGWLPRPRGWAKVIAQRTVRSLMNGDPVSLRGEQTVPDLVETVLRAGVRSLPVIDAGGKILGIVTDNDLISRKGIPLRLGLLIHLSEGERREFLRDVERTPMGEIMTTPAITVRAAHTLQEAVALLKQYDLKRLPVVDGDGHLVGKLTRSDILRELAFVRGIPHWAQEEGPPYPDWSATVKQIASNNLASVAPYTPLTDLIEIMVEAQQRRILVLDPQERVVGVITDSDLFLRTRPQDRLEVIRRLQKVWTGKDRAVSSAIAPLVGVARDVMTSPVVTIHEDASLQAALRLLMAYQIKQLPVVDNRGRALGWVGRTLIFQAFFPVVNPSLALPASEEGIVGE